MEENRRRWCGGGREVPVAGGGNTIKWIEISVPSPSPSSEDNVCLVLPSSSEEEDYTSSSVIGDPPISFVCRINKTNSNVLEVLQLSSKSEFLLTGIRFSFAHKLYPFAFPFVAHEGSASGPLRFFLYAFTPSSAVYVLNLSNALAYESGSVFRHDHFTHVDVRRYLNEAQVTSVTACPGSIFLGRSDGCVSCFQPFLSRQEPLSDVAAVIDLSILEFEDGPFINVLHADGKLSVWDILSRTKMMCESVAAENCENFICWWPFQICLIIHSFTSVLTFFHAVFVPLRLWVGIADYDNQVIPLVVSRRHNLVNVITVFFIRFTFQKFVSFFLQSGHLNIPLQGGELRDVRFTSDRILILKADELISQMLSYKSSNMETQSYILQEEYISEQLFLTPASSLHELRLTTHSLFSSSKDRIMGFISSIFLGRLLCLGIFDDVALRLTLRDHNKCWSDSEFQSLSLDELRREILSLVEQEVTGETTISVFHWWETFCKTYLDHWRNNNGLRTLLVQSDGIGLVRNNSVSLFFSLENAENSLGGPSFEHSNLTSLDLGMSHNEHERLLEILKCTLKIRKKLGGAPCAMYYELVTGKPVISSDDIVPRLVNILGSGYAMSIDQRTWLDLGADRGWEKELKSHRMFSIHMLLSISTLCQRAGSWEKVFDIMENYLQYLAPKKFRHDNNGESLSDICSSILVQATTQFAKVMFESAFDIVLLLSYLLNISEKVNMSEQDICKLRHKLLPMIQYIVTEWLIILSFLTTPAESISMDDCSFKLSFLQIDSSIDKMVGKCGFSLAYILLLSDRSCIVDSRYDLRYLPNSQVVTSLVQNFVSWICYIKTGEDTASLLRPSSELTLRLIRNGQANKVERILEVMEGILRGEKTFGHVQDTSGDWSLLQHLRGCCFFRFYFLLLLFNALNQLFSNIISFLCRASSGEKYWKALHSLAKEAGFFHSTIGASI
ncbi:unnamed protein product [Eruca vesicaria subsp. sativa]|uniref:NUP160 helical domain-containing protein n=1 Tax=Eruca vesicaria subsp. sativa TaxID=29727 RepID=A0ABC8KPW4_ERUVS|nr:unnamed protein product [Eruca vesicaria subsp. sativa]